MATLAKARLTEPTYAPGIQSVVYYFSGRLQCGHRLGTTIKPPQ